ncbi:hypothetical protein PJE062_2226 [Pseudovibrio sp. JE062]|nr:hypothetical protein PJE062_2226 [Pseudovibrio sp. JE062]
MLTCTNIAPRTTTQATGFLSALIGRAGQLTRNKGCGHCRYR